MLLYEMAVCPPDLYLYSLIVSHKKKPRVSPGLLMFVGVVVRLALRSRPEALSDPWLLQTLHCHLQQAI
jgi:hypothetical protein